jgi:hypothetical protein
VTARERAHAVREALSAAALSDGGPTVGGIAVGGPAAGSMVAEANFAGFDMLLRTYLDYHDLEEQASLAFLGERRTCRPVLGILPFCQGPDDMAAFPAIYEIIRKINHMLLVGRYFGPQEDLGTVCILSAFTEDSDKIAHTALEDATVSDARSYHLHSVLRALLQAYLQSQAAKEWRRLCEDLVWSPVFSRIWTEAVRLYDSSLLRTFFTSNVSTCHCGRDFC